MSPPVTGETQSFITIYISCCGCCCRSFSSRALLVIFGVFVFNVLPTVDVADDEGNSKTLQIGYFLQESQPPYRIGAIKLAVDKAKADGYLQDYDVR